MKVGDRVKTTHSDTRVCVLGTVTDVRGEHVSIRWDGWSAPRWIQMRGLVLAKASKKKSKKRLNTHKGSASKK